MEVVNVIIQCLVEDRVMRVCVACAGLVDIHFPSAKDLELLELMVCNSRQACACDGPDHRCHAASSVWICEDPCNSNIVVVGVAARKRQSRLHVLWNKLSHDQRQAAASLYSSTFAP
jgi:hypothetical protein